VLNDNAGFGQFEVTGGLLTDDTIYRYGALEGEVLSSLTGPMGYTAFADGGFRLLPRSAEDIVSVSRPTKTLPQLLDSTATDAIEGCDFCPGATSTCTASVVAVENMVVVSDAYYITTGSRGPIIGFFIADPNAVDSGGRLTAYSGILVSYTPEYSGSSHDGYTFSLDQDDRIDDPTTAPRIGDVVDVVGENAGFCGQPQLSSVANLRKVGTVDTVDGVTMPLPALFDGDASALLSPRPAVTVATGGEDIAAVTGSATINEWLGVLVELKDVDTTNACQGSPFSTPSPHMRDFGYWQVTGGAEIGTLFYNDFGGYWLNVAYDSADRLCSNTANKCEDSRALGQTFTSLTGIVNFSFDIYRVNPRGLSDIGDNSLFVAEGTPTAACTAP
jgi:hypothetical protein